MVLSRRWVPAFAGTTMVFATGLSFRPSDPLVRGDDVRALKSLPRRKPGASSGFRLQEM